MRIPAINIDTQVKEVGLDKNGNMVVPTNGDYAVWLGASAPPGVVGNAVFAGHLDWAGKLGVFYRIKDLSKGDVVEITATDGTKRQFAVTGRQLYDRIKAPLDEIYGPTASASITLITCGGTFLKDVHDYSHRLVVRAELRQS